MVARPLARKVIFVKCIHASMNILREYYRYFSDEMDYDEFVKMVNAKKKMYGNLYDDETIILYFLAKRGKLKEIEQKGRI